MKSLALICLLSLFGTASFANNVKNPVAFIQTDLTTGYSASNLKYDLVQNEDGLTLTIDANGKNGTELPLRHVLVHALAEFNVYPCNL